MIDAQQLLDYVVRPVNKSLDLWSEAADRLLIGTACQESNLRYLHQQSGPAIGLWQMEPATYDDCWLNFLAYQPTLGPRVKAFAFGLVLNNADEMHGNLYLAAAMCRVKYYADKDPIPDTLPGQAAYWKRVYNTEMGMGRVTEYLNNWQRYAGSVRF